MILTEDYIAWITAACAFCFIYIMFFSKSKSQKFPPGPRGLPIIGYMPFMGKYPHKTFVDLSKIYGPVFSVNVGVESWVILNDYDVIHEALVKKGSVFSGRRHDFISYKITEGLGIGSRDNDEIWKIQRKFGITTLRGFGVGKRRLEDRIVEEAKYLCDEIETKNERSFHCQNMFSNALANIICSVVMGSRFSYDDERLGNIVKRINRSFSDNFDARMIGVLSFVPVLRFFPPFHGVYKRLFEDVQCVLDILETVIQEHKKSYDVNNIRDFIDEFLKYMKEGRETFHERQLLQYMRDLLVAGIETTTSTIRWCIFCLTLHCEHQDKIAKEIKDVIGNSGIPSMKHRDEMVYTRAFIQEIMRYQTLAPMSLPHKTTENVSFRGYNIPKNTPVIANLWAVHHDPSHFVNPDEFRPERFIDVKGRFVPDNHVIPFSIGPRYCLGEQLARMEVFLILTCIIQKFKIVADPQKPLPDFEGVFLGQMYVPKNFEVAFLPR